MTKLQIDFIRAFGDKTIKKCEWMDSGDGEVARKELRLHCIYLRGKTSKI